MSSSDPSSASSNHSDPSNNNNNSVSNGVFEKQRDLLLQEISQSINSVIYNFEILNRSLNSSIQVGKEFNNISNLWSLFYNGLNEETGNGNTNDNGRKSEVNDDESDKNDEVENNEAQIEDANEN